MFPVMQNNLKRKRGAQSEAQQSEALQSEVINALEFLLHGIDPMHGIEHLVAQESYNERREHRLYLVTQLRNAKRTLRKLKARAA